MAQAPRAASSALRQAILAWYASRGRDLAFRAASDPYAILVSESMAQQTQAARAADYWTRFMVEFPTADALACAPPAAVLRAWRGLGYNRRAINLRNAAVAIVRDHDGRVPSDVEALERLPGVGPYTARAVAALAFGRPVGAVDVNVRRVLNRAVGGSLGSFSAAEVQAVADASVPASSPGAWTHAVMDVGASFCKPREPRCEACPAQPACAFAIGRSGIDDARHPKAAIGVGDRGPDVSGLEDPDAAVAAPARSPRSRHAGPPSGNCGTPPRSRRELTKQSRSRAGPRSARERPAPFTDTTRWLRGRIVDLLRDMPDGTWLALPVRIGVHDRSAIETAAAALERDGLLDRDPDDQWRARLPIA